MSGEKLTQDELAALFGDTIPIEAVNLIWSSPPEMTVGQIREKLAQMAPGWRRKNAIERAVRDYFREIVGLQLAADLHAQQLTQEIARVLDQLRSPIAVGDVAYERKTIVIRDIGTHIAIEVIAAATILDDTGRIALTIDTRLVP